MIVVIIAVIDTIFMSGHSLQWLADIPFLGFVLLVIGLFLQVPVALIANSLSGFAHNTASIWLIIITISFIIGAILGWIYGKIKNKTNGTKNDP